MRRARIVHLEWDRGHEQFDAIVRAESVDGIIVSEYHDFTIREGWRWLPTGEIASINPLPDDCPVVRITEARAYPDLPIEVDLTRLPALLSHLAASDEIVGVYRAATGSDELLVGRISRLDESSFELDLVSSEGSWEDEAHEYESFEVISIEWGTDYLTAMRDLAGPR